MNKIYIYFLVLLTAYINTFAHNTEKQFVVIVPSYNNARWYKRNLDSIFEQTYKNYRVIYIDDCSRDGTAQLVEDYVKEQKQDDKVTLVKNTERRAPLANRYYAIRTCKDDEIMVMLDGDDWFSRPDVLEILNEVYSDPNIWMTYGQYEYWCTNCAKEPLPELASTRTQCEHREGIGWCRELPPREIIDNNGWKEYIQNTVGGWVFGALRTFYAGLFKQIKKEDLMCKGKFFGRGSDLATTVPLAGLAGHHIKFIPEVLYVYNREMPVAESENWEMCNHIGYKMHLQKRYYPTDTFYPCKK